MKDEKSEGEEICRQETVYVFTERSALACSAVATAYFYFFFCRPPQLGCLTESEKNKLDVRDHFKIILLWTSSQLYGYKYPA